MKHIIVFVGAVLALMSLTSTPTEAGVGQILVFRAGSKTDARPRDSVRIEKMKKQIDKLFVDLSYDSSKDASEELQGSKPVPFDEGELEEDLEAQDDYDFFAEGRGFEEPLQRAVIFWNGNEEILTMTSTQKSLIPADGVALSVMPLPGPPLDIYRSNENLFEKCCDLIRSKTPQLNYTDASRPIVAFKIDDEKDLYAAFDAYVEQEFGKDASAYIGNKQREILQYYADSGFRYFVIDSQTNQSGVERNKETVTYRFKTDKLFYPLVINRLGGFGLTRIELVVVTPNKLTNFSGIKSNTQPSEDSNESLPQYLVTQTTRFAITSTLDEIRKLSADAADLLKDYEKCLVRHWVIEGQMDGFKSDLIVTEK